MFISSLPILHEIWARQRLREDVIEMLLLQFLPMTFSAQENMYNYGIVLVLCAHFHFTLGSRPARPVRPEKCPIEAEMQMK